MDACGLTEDQIALPSVQDQIQVPRPVVPTFKANWPVKEAAHSSFEKAILGEDAVEVEEETAENGYEVEEEEEEEEAVNAPETPEEDEYLF